MNATIVFHAGLLAYALSAGFFLAHLVHATPRRERIARRALVVGFLLNGAAVAARMASLALSGGGLFRLDEALSLVAFLLAGAWLLFDRWYRIPTLGAFATPLIVAMLLPAHAIPGASTGASRGLGPLLPLHVAVSIGGFALFALGFVVALMYLLLERELKAKRPGAMFKRLPSLEALDRLNYQLVLLGFLLLTVTIGTGAFFYRGDDGLVFSMRTKEGFALVAWLVAALVVLFRQTVGWRGRRVAWATMAGFVLMGVAFAGIFTGSSV
ncbi:MAG TPA: cytochrome c biogenesis protein CcsA [Vulgatibacter sp.]|nr:cytochrome c biogenesis protein CcsA [Vulgatibacter sp.]